MNLLITNIGILAGIRRKGRLRLQGKEMQELETLQNAYLLVDDDKVKDYGLMDELSKIDLPESITVEDAKGGTVLPTWCDSHTHIVYAGSREGEFVDKIRGLSYAEIARRGGGILNSADQLHEMGEDELFEQAMVRVNEVISKGTGCIEIKSGYGLNTADELKMLRVIRRIGQSSAIQVVPTFLGAHAVSRAYSGRQSAYVDMLIEEMIPEVGRQQLAKYIDVFCDEGFFTVEETARILEAGADGGFFPRFTQKNWLLREA